MSRIPGSLRTAIAAALAVSCVLGVPSTAAGRGLEAVRTFDAQAGASSDGAPDPRDDWVWPLAAFRIAKAYAAPAHEYGPGHRGIDLAPAGGEEVRAPAGGVVAFSGRIVDRGILTIDHGDGLVTTLEPIDSDLAAGQAVARGQVVGTVARGGHAAAGTIHFGVRWDGAYINPMLLFGTVPRAVLLPCCS
ncbi:murein hydrolase activator EnvC family protein [Microbacterium elymi]|uniref:M23 family metallopeptidase n=1 Tax=Microbacterium elymi TaxID=2909587 RepID=A0ABY5NJU2_9MICO|nr:M23 family metallopeptidase [Microbacterium elymi]UUT35434.1 M23 family metallopeptidase [Microbacterium elymi]